MRTLLTSTIIYKRIFYRFNLDGSWSETGDRYMLKLYRDYLFHAVNEDGRPFLDVGHITYSLNQLDAGCHTMASFYYDSVFDLSES